MFATRLDQFIVSMAARRRHAGNLQLDGEDEEDMDAYRVTYHTDMVCVLITLPTQAPPPPPARGKPSAKHPPPVQRSCLRGLTQAMQDAMPPDPYAGVLSV